MYRQLTKTWLPPCNSLVFYGTLLRLQDNKEASGGPSRCFGDRTLTRGLGAEEEEEEEEEEENEEEEEEDEEEEKEEEGLLGPTRGRSNPGLLRRRRWRPGVLRRPGRGGWPEEDRRDGEAEEDTEEAPGPAGAEGGSAAAAGEGRAPLPLLPIIIIIIPSTQGLEGSWATHRSSTGTCGKGSGRQPTGTSPSSGGSSANSPGSGTRRTQGGRTPLHLACASGHIDVVAFLIDSKCQLNLCDSDMRTPLMKAVQCRQELCAIHLLECGVDPNEVDARGNMALHLAASTASRSLAKHLLGHGARLEVPNQDGSTPLMAAVVENDCDMVEFLLKSGASVHVTDKAGRTPLMLAVSNRKQDVTNLLLAYGSNISHQDDSGWSAWDYATLSDDPILLRYIADNSKWEKGGESSADALRILSMLDHPGRVGDLGVTLGAPATNIEVIDDPSAGDSVRDSVKTNDTWRSSEEEDLEPSPKKPSLARLLSISQRPKQNHEESRVPTDPVVGAQPNRSVCDAGDASDFLPKSLFHARSFPQPVRSSPGSFSRHSQMAAYFVSKQEGSFEEEKEEDDEENGESPGVAAQYLHGPAISLNQISSREESAKKGCSANAKPEPDTMDLEPAAASSALWKQGEAREKPQSDLMEELGLDNTDDIEDASDWDSPSLSQGLPCPSAYNALMWGDPRHPAHLPPGSACPGTSGPARAEEATVTEMSMALKGPLRPDINTEEIGEGETKGKNVIAVPGSLKKQLPEKRTNEAELIDPDDRKQAGGEVCRGEAGKKSSSLDPALWEDRYEKLWVAQEKKEVKSNFKNITAELKVKFGEIGVGETPKESAADTFGGGNQPPPPRQCAMPIGIQ